MIENQHAMQLQLIQLQAKMDAPRRPRALLSKKPFDLGLLGLRHGGLVLKEFFLLGCLLPAKTILEGQIFLM